jgi:hypothetical protein
LKELQLELELPSRWDEEETEPLEPVVVVIDLLDEDDEGTTQA